MIPSLRLLLLATAFLALPAVGLYAQPKGPPNALQGFSQNRGKPVHIEAAMLEVRNKNKVATFSGDVHVRQGDTYLRCKTLKVFYEQAGKGKGLQADAPTPGAQQKIKRLEARGDVIVMQKNQTASGDLGVFDMKTNTVTLLGHVVMTRGKDVLRGDKLVVNLTSGVSRVESSKQGHGRVQGLFQSSGTGRESKPGGSTALRPIH